MQEKSTDSSTSVHNSVKSKLPKWTEQIGTELNQKREEENHTIPNLIRFGSESYFK